MISDPRSSISVREAKGANGHYLESRLVCCHTMPCTVFEVLWHILLPFTAEGLTLLYQSGRAWPSCQVGGNIVSKYFDSANNASRSLYPTPRSLKLYPLFFPASPANRNIGHNSLI